jgi:hypothetical protein
VTGSNLPDSTIRINDLISGDLIKKFKNLNESIYEVTINSDNKFIVGRTEICIFVLNIASEEITL